MILYRRHFMAFQKYTYHTLTVTYSISKKYLAGLLVTLRVDHDFTVNNSKECGF